MNLTQKAYQAKTGELQRHWYVIDAKDQVVGRLAAQIAPILMGKHRPTYTSHIDTGDYVIVVNVDKVVFTGNKWQQKSYQRYSGWPGGQRDETAWKLFERRPERILELAVRRMMPKNKLARHMMGKLKLFVGPNHPHQAQLPITLEPKAGRPTASGIVLAPLPTPKAPRVVEKKPKAEFAPAAVEETKPVAELTAPAPVAELAGPEPVVELAPPSHETPADAAATTPPAE